MIVLVYLNVDGDSKYLKLKCITYQNTSSKIIMWSSMKKTFYDQALDSDTKRYEGIRKLTTGQGEFYTTECLLDYGI